MIKRTRYLVYSVLGAVALCLATLFSFGIVHAEIIYTDIEAPAGFSNFTNFASASCFLSANRVNCSIPDGSHNDQGAQFDVVVPVAPDVVYGLAIDIVSVGSFNNFKFDGGLVDQDTSATTGNRICMIDDDVIDVITVTVELGCDQVHSDMVDFNPENTTMRTVVDCPSGGAGCTPTSFIVDLWFIVPYSAPPPPPPPDIEGDPFAICVFTSTVTLTETVSISPSVEITTVQEVTYTRAANLVDNPSFETPNPSGPGPAGWSPAVGGTVNTGVPDYYDENGLSYHGVDSVFNAAVFDLYTSVTTWKSGDYAIGYFANGANTQLFWNGVLKATSTAVTSTFQIYTNTFSVGGGASWLSVAFRTDDEETNVDAVFVYPIDENGNLICDPSYYAPYDEDDSTVNIGGVPGPIGGAGTICYRCTPPTGLSYLDVSYWIAWLGCVLRNMFSCSLRVWLLVIGNWLAGLVQIALAWIVWIPSTVQGGADWFAESVTPLFGGVTIVYQNSTNLWDLLIAVIGLIATIITSLSGLVITLVQLIIGLIGSIQGAFSADPYVFDFNTSGPGPGPGTAALLTEGPNDDKILYLFLVTLGVFDQSFIGTHSEILLIVMGTVGIGLAIWTLNFWKEIISF